MIFVALAFILFGCLILGDLLKDHEACKPERGTNDKGAL